MRWYSRLLIVAFAITVTSQAVVDEFAAAENLATLRGEAPLSKQGKPPLIRPFKNTDIKKIRNYPEQPPLIPHSIEGYQVDMRSNKCLSCHARARTGESQAPMVSITHFMDRDNQFRAQVSPRRYFCTQCHVPQRDVKPLLKNRFLDIDTILGMETGVKKK